MRPAARHIRGLAALILLMGLAGCAREDEAAQRARLAAWVSLGETVSFEAQAGCAVGVYALVTDEVKSALPLTDSVPAMRRAIADRGAAAVRLPGQGADRVLVAMANHHRETGMAMRRAALEARACMDETPRESFAARSISRARWSRGTRTRACSRSWPPARGGSSPSRARAEMARRQLSPDVPSRNSCWRIGSLSMERVISRTAQGRVCAGISRHPCP